MDHLAGRTSGGLNGSVQLTVGSGGTVTDDGLADSFYADPLKPDWEVDLTTGHNP